MKYDLLLRNQKGDAFPQNLEGMHRFLRSTMESEPSPTTLGYQRRP
jgi:hypothetical protein